MRRALALLAFAVLAPAAALAQSAGEVERCFQNPAVCGQGRGHAVGGAEPPPQTAPAPSTTPPPSNADALKALQARLAERRKAAEPKAEAAAQSLIRDLKAYVAADGKGVAGDQFAAFAKWYADNKAAGRKVGEIAPIIDDYGDAKVGAAVATEILLETKQDGNSQSQCLVFPSSHANPRNNTQAFSCDDVAAVEKWKTDQALKSAWR